MGEHIYMKCLLGRKKQHNSPRALCLIHSNHSLKVYFYYCTYYLFTQWIRVNPESAFIVYFNAHIKQLNIFPDSNNDIAVLSWRRICSSQRGPVSTESLPPRTIQSFQTGHVYTQETSYVNSKGSSCIPTQDGIHESCDHSLCDNDKKKKKEKNIFHWLYAKIMLNIFNWFLIFNSHSTSHRKTLWSSPFYI